MKRALFVCALAAVVVFVKPARADDFIISFTSTSGLGYSGSGVFDATSMGDGEYQINSVISGSATDITGAAPGTYSIVGVNSDLGADNLLFYPADPSMGFFDGNGLTFALADGTDINLYALQNIDGTYSPVSVEVPAIGSGFPEYVNESVAFTPEPGSLVLLGTSVLGAAGMLRRRLMA